MKHIKVFEDFNKANPVNEAMSLKDYYRNSDKEVKDIAKQIDMIIDHAVGNASQKNELLDLITDLTDAYLADMRDEE
jgi:Mg2+ and Co2+ transporter CorA